MTPSRHDGTSMCHTSILKNGLLPFWQGHKYNTSKSLHLLLRTLLATEGKMAGGHFSGSTNQTTLLKETYLQSIPETFQEKESALKLKAFFNRQVLSWFDKHGRKTLPWQQPVSPYRVWVSEVMLQQTQVSTAIPYFNNFMAAFPTISDLAHSAMDTVLYHWSGLGYYSRARNLHKTAQIIMQQFNGQLPDSVIALTTLPGIGRSTAGAIVSIAMNTRAPILDGNVKRVLTRFFAIAGWPGKTAVEKQLWQLAEFMLPNGRHNHYTQAMMDMGALICTRSKPLCSTCPLHTKCAAYQNGQVSSFPSSKPQKKLPVKKTRLLILINRKKEVLLEKRCEKGIWGGMWSLPEFSLESDLETEAATYTGYRLHSLKSRPVLRHTFSHYHLDISPIQAHITDTPATCKMQEERWCWYSHSIKQIIGIPAPIKKLLEQL